MVTDQPDDPLAAFALIDSPAVVDRIAQQGQIVRPQLGRDSFREFRAHLAQGAVAVRLKERDDAAGVSFQRVECRGDLVRVVAEIVDYRDI